MKIKLCIAFMLGLIVIGSLCGCGTSADGTESLFEVEMIADATDIGSIEDELIDNTAQFSNSFTVEGKAVIQYMAVAVDFGVIYPDLESVYNKASNVVVGEVMDVQYTDDEAAPRTIYTFAVSETLKGDIAENSLISISESNGYVRMTMVLETYGMIPYVLDQGTNLYSRFCPNENPELYAVHDSVTNAVIQEEPMPLSKIREVILSY